jgi:uncharacterized protein YprB with RNaseH-like and TPR domain
MQIDPQQYIKLIEDANQLCFFDIEASGLRGDYNSVYVVSILPYLDEKPYSFFIKQAGNDQKVVKDAKDALSRYSCWCGYYSKGFDKPMLNTRLLKWGQEPLPPRHHIDMYFSLKANLLTARKSQGHLLSWLGTPEQKMSVSADAWSEMPFKMDEHLPVMIDRCESDVMGLRDLYNRTKHLIKDIKNG